MQGSSPCNTGYFMPKESQLHEGDRVEIVSVTERAWLRDHGLRRCCICWYIKSVREFPLPKLRTCTSCAPLRRERQLARLRSWHSQLRSEVLAAYGGRCACCGESTREFLAVDHINGGGKKHRKELGSSGTSFYVWLRDNSFPDMCRLLCHNCNFSRGAYGYCPHENPPITSQ